MVATECKSLNIYHLTLRCIISTWNTRATPNYIFAYIRRCNKSGKHIHTHTEIPSALFNRVFPNAGEDDRAFIWGDTKRPGSLTIMKPLKYCHQSTRCAKESILTNLQ